MAAMQETMEKVQVPRKARAGAEASVPGSISCRYASLRCRNRNRGLHVGRVHRGGSPGVEMRVPTLCCAILSTHLCDCVHSPLPYSLSESATEDLGVDNSGVGSQT